MGAAARKRAACGQIHELWHGSGNGGQTDCTFCGVELRACSKQAACIGVGAPGEHRFRHAGFHYGAAIHDQQLLRILGNHAQIMADENQRHGMLGHQLLQQIQNALLNRHIQGRGGLVGHQQIGTAGQSHGNHDALALAAGELVRIFIEPLRSLRNAHPLQQLGGAGASLGAAHSQMKPQRLCHLAADAVHGVEGAHGLLKHHGHAVAAQGAELALAQAQQLLAVQLDAAVHLCMFGQQAHQRQCRQRFAAA